MLASNCDSLPRIRLGVVPAGKVDFGGYNADAIEPFLADNALTGLRYISYSDDSNSYRGSAEFFLALWATLSSYPAGLSGS